MGKLRFFGVGNGRRVGSLICSLKGPNANPGGRVPWLRIFVAFLRAAADAARTSDHGRFPAHFRIVVPFVVLLSELRIASLH